MRPKLPRVRQAWLVACLALAGPPVAAAGEGGAAKPKPPDPAEVVAAGKRTAAKLQTTPASWKAVFTRERPGQVVVETLSTRDKSRFIVSERGAGERKSAEKLRIVERDGAWYVTQRAGRGGRGKYRPFEAPLTETTMYLYLFRAELLVVTDPTPGALGKYEKTEKGVATYRTPVREPARSQLANMIRQAKTLAKRDPKFLKRPGVKEQLAAMKELLEKGTSTRVDLASGLLVEHGTRRMRTRIEDFKWLGKVDGKHFAIPEGDWPDHTSDPTRGKLTDLLLIAHAAGRTEPDNCLLNVKTGRYRRVPFRGAVSLTGCFLKGRKKVAVSGTNTVQGVVGIYEIDLSTGANRQLGGKLLATGFSMFPTLSPDGKTLAVFHKDMSEKPAEAQVCLVDVKTGAARKLGRLLDCAHISWSADGKSLLMTVRKMVDVLRPASSFVCRMDLAGKLTEVRKGSRPLALRGGRRILFLDADALWKTCNLAGKDVKKLGDGLKGANHPTLSPRGKRLIMMIPRPGPDPRPFIIDIANGKAKPLKVSPGEWLFPSWK